MYHLVASVGADALKTTINPDDEILTVLGGKASCRRKFVINVHLLDEAGNNVHEEFAIIASVAYAHDRSPIVQDENLFLAEPPLLTTFNGVEYPSQDRPTRLVGGKASFKLAISLLSSKYDNRLFSICFTPRSCSSHPDVSSSTSANSLPQPCYSKPIRSISRKRGSSSAAPPPLPCITHRLPPQADASMLSPPPASKFKSPDHPAREDIEKFFTVSSATSSSEDDDKPNCQHNGDAASDSGSLRYIASNNYKQEAQLLLQPDAIHGDPYYNIHESYSARQDPFIGIGGAHCEGYLIRRDPHCKDSLMHVDEHGGGCYMDPSGRLSKVDMLINGRFSPNPVVSRSESTSPISGILTSDGSMEQTDVLSQPSCITAVAMTERPLSASHPGSHLSSPFRPYNPNAGTSKASPSDFQQGSSRSPSYVNGLTRESPEGLLLVGRPISDHLMQSTLVTSSSKKSLDIVLQRFLTEASNHAISESGISPDSNIEDEEQSLLALEVALQDAIRELEKKKEELRSKRQRLLEENEARMHNIVFQSSSWVESLSRKYNY